MEHDDVPLPTASRQDGRHPRPQLLRARWADLGGVWSFAFDDDDRGLADGWFRTGALDRLITVPFPFESSASGIGDTGFHPVVWYARTIGAEELAEAGASADRPRVLLHFGAVDFRAEVWVDGEPVGRHEGGHTPFSVELPRGGDGRSRLIVVRVEDDPADVGQPRGKQDWREQAHSIWYDRTTGIWQPVWLEAVPEVAVASLHWRPDLPAATVTAEVRLNRVPPAELRLRIRVEHDGEVLGWTEAPLGRDRATVFVALPAQGNGQSYEELLWTPERPVLLDATVELLDATGARVDAVSSYFGLVSARVEGGAFLLNDRPRFLRAVLEQGFWPDSHLAAPSAAALRDEVQLILDLGFDTVRLHQKIEDPRLLHWADRLGLMVWGETAGAYEFGAVAVRRSVDEWMAAVDRDRSHPCVVAWVPLNESWGVQHIAHEPAQQAYSSALAQLTRALDPGRPVISNDGWEHAGSDILSIHDYEADPAVLQARYGPGASRAALVDGVGPAGRRILVGDAVDGGQPIMLTEFGGVRFDVRDGERDGWGYSSASDADDYEARLRGIVDAVAPGGLLAGWCWTQLTDTMQEVNGLVDEHRRPKLPIEVLRAVITGGAR